MRYLSIAVLLVLAACGPRELTGPQIRATEVVVAAGLRAEIEALDFIEAVITLNGTEIMDTMQVDGIFRATGEPTEAQLEQLIFDVVFPYYDRDMNIVFDIVHGPADSRQTAVNGTVTVVQNGNDRDINYTWRATTIETLPQRQTDIAATPTPVIATLTPRP